MLSDPSNLPLCEWMDTMGDSRTGTATLWFRLSVCGSLHHLLFRPPALNLAIQGLLFNYRELPYLMLQTNPLPRHGQARRNILQQIEEHLLTIAYAGAPFSSHTKVPVLAHLLFRPSQTKLGGSSVML